MREMRASAAGIVAVAWFLVSAPGASPTCAAAKRQWQTGRVLAGDLSGHGPSEAGKTERSRRGDIWWTYCVAAAGKSYLVVSRVNPSKAGMPVNGTIRFYLDKKRMNVLNSRGERLTLRIQREERRNTCR